MSNLLETAAYLEVDGRVAIDQDRELSEQERAGLEVDRIIQVAYEEHEVLVYERGMAELARRETIIAKTLPPYTSNIKTLQAEYEEEVRYLKQLLPDEDLDWLDEFSY
ncbi:hypothetical protein KR222_011057 [Zaprionus bogoriensis]|nr:hypothetical protein KR222_011057 [Zaprionus bogoriensis]